MSPKAPLPVRILIPVANPMTAEAREFELLKPYLVKRWNEASAEAAG